MLSSNYTAEVGRSGGGAVTIVTRGGEQRLPRLDLRLRAQRPLQRQHLLQQPARPQRADGQPQRADAAPALPQLRRHLQRPRRHPQASARARQRDLERPRQDLLLLLARAAPHHARHHRVDGHRAHARRARAATSRPPSACRSSARTPRRPRAAPRPAWAPAPPTPSSCTDTNGNNLQARAGMIFRLADNRAYAGNIVPASRHRRALARAAARPTRCRTPAPRSSSTRRSTALKTRQETIRIDHIFNDNHRLFGRYTHDLNLTHEPTGLFTTNARARTSARPTRASPARRFVASLTSVLSPTLVNEATYNFSSNLIGSQVVGPQLRLRLPRPRHHPRGLPREQRRGRPAHHRSRARTPTSTRSRASTSSTRTRSSATSSPGRAATTPSSSAARCRGRRRTRTPTTSRRATSASRARARAASARRRDHLSLTQTGLAFADFLLGRADTYTEDQFDVTVNLRFGRREFFAQDTWKVRPNLTLDLGVRYQFFVPVTDENNVLTIVRPGALQPRQRADLRPRPPARRSCAARATS